MPITRVCSSCFDDLDLRVWIRDCDGPRGCHACGRHDSPTCRLIDICRYIEFCLRQYWSFAVDHLPYESAEGGYQGATWTTIELLQDEVELSLPRDTNDDLLDALLDCLPDDLWCEYDWLTLDHDVALKTSWDRFCATVKHKRRFFFHSTGSDDRDSYTPASLLNEIAVISQNLGLIRTLSTGTALWRARPDLPTGKRGKASDFGPPPPEYALQSNRMNPPGIPMLYLASTARTALRETRVEVSRVGKWLTARPLRILDLRRLPKVPGLFSTMERNDRLALLFLHEFADDIMTPVERDNRVHVDYLPSQVVTEYLRDFAFDGGKIEGIAYESTVTPRGWNVALFAGPTDLGLDSPEWGEPTTPWLNFECSVCKMNKSSEAD